MRSILLKALLAAVVTVGVLATSASASHFRYGNYTWVSTGPLTVEFTLANAWRRDGYTTCYNTGAAGPCTGPGGFPAPGDVILETIGATTFNPGEGPVLGNPLRYLVTSIDIANNWLFALALDPADLPAQDTTIDKTYSTGGDKLAFTASSARIGNLINAANANYRVETIVNVGGTNHPPVSTVPPIVNCPISGLCTFQIPATDSDGDALTYRFSTAAESGIPSQPGPPFAPNAASVSSSGVYSWNTTGAQLALSGPTYYATQVTIEDRDGSGALKSKVAVDFLIQLVTAVGTPPSFSSPTLVCGSTVNGNVGSAVNLTVQASDPDVGDTITLTAAGVPPGATFNPALPTSGNPVQTVFSWTPSATGSTIVTFAATDSAGNQALCSVTLNISGNQPPSVEAGNNVSGSEGSAIALDATVGDLDGDTVTQQWTYTAVTADAGATCSFASATSVDTTITCTDDGTYTATLTANDGHNASVSDSTTVTVANADPTVNITTPTDGQLYPITTAVALTASHSDAGTNDTHTCSVAWDDGNTTAGTVSETNGSGTCSAGHTYSSAGVYTIQVTVTDDDGGSGTDTVMVVVYDPSAGFVTGGGWFDSPAGAYAADPAAAGRANFGFVSKYKKGATIPEGNTEFQFQAGNLNFHSETYQWLVVNANGCRAQYKGTGTINGTGSYGFMLWAYDGNCTAEPGPDKFRMKIWNASDETSVVYDNGFAGYSTGQPLGGGSIVIHTTKK